MNVVRQEFGDNWAMYQGDCVETIRNFQDNSVDFTIFSPPFSQLYIYSDSIADMGNCKDHDEFFQHFNYLIPELYRVTVPGRLCSVHCKDLPLYLNRDGAFGLYDFPGDIIRAFQAHGWVFGSRVTIWKDPVIEMQRTKNHGLLYRNFRLRSEVCRQGMADYVITFRRPTEDGSCEKPVLHDAADFELPVWQRWASPVWMDINQTDVLNYQQARSDADEKHICPLQLPVAERCIALWSNPGDTVLSPFAGIGSEGYMALKLGRRFTGIELKLEYWRVAVKNLQEAERLNQVVDLFQANGIVV